MKSPLTCKLWFLFILILLKYHDIISVTVKQDATKPVIKESNIVKLNVTKQMIEESNIEKYFISKKKFILEDNLLNNIYCW